MQIFISYRRSDQAFAEQLRDALRSWGYKTWLDIDDIPKGAYWADEIDRGLEKSDVVVGIISPEAIESRNVKNEWYWALDHKRLVPLLLHPCILPHRIHSANYIDATQDQPRALEHLRVALSDSARPTYKEEIASPVKKTVATQTQNDNRSRMLAKVRENWIHGVLDNALRDSQFELGMELKPDAVLKHIDYGDYVLPNTAGILRIFDDMGGELLILGAPGAGKTILLLQLAEKLIDRAEIDVTKPIPVIFNLASWAREKLLLQDWLIERLFREYGVPRKQGKRWVDNEQIVLLLDGLDEVKEDVRNSCVDAINTFRRYYQTMDIVVCSRIDDYELLTSQLNLQTALMVQPLTNEDIDTHLAPAELAALREMLSRESHTAEMAKTPFLLNTMMRTYRGSSLINLSHVNTKQARLNHLLSNYLKLGFTQNYQDFYSLVQIRAWLSWLADKMAKNKQSIFYIEGLQPDWLSNQKHQQIYQLSTLIGIGVVFGLLFAPLGGLEFGVMFGVVFGLLFILRKNIETAESIGWALSQRNLKFGLTGGLLVGLLAGLMTDLANGLVDGLVVGLVVGLFAGLKNNEVLAERTKPNQGIRLSAYNVLKIWLVFGLLVGLLAGLLGGLLIGLLNGLLLGLLIGLFVGLLGGLLIGGVATIKHPILRIILWRFNYAPLNYAQFLDYCASIGIMRKVGGGYIFQHRILLEYFASLYDDNPQRP